CHCRNRLELRLRNKLILDCMSADCPSQLGWELSASDQHGDRHNPYERRSSTMSASDIDIRTSACPLDCPDGCSLDVTVRDGRVESLDGNHVNRLTAGFICGKVRHFADRMYGADRVLFPAVRVGPKGTAEFRCTSWEEALELIAGRLAETRDQFGGEAILPYHY